MGDRKSEPGMVYYSLESSNHIRQYLPSSSGDLKERINRRFSTMSHTSERVDEDEFPSMLGRELAKNIQSKRKACESLIRLKY